MYECWGCGNYTRAVGCVRFSTHCISWNIKFKFAVNKLAYSKRSTKDGN